MMKLVAFFIEHARLRSRVAWGAAGAALVLSYAAQSFRWTTELRSVGAGYASVEWRSSETVEYVGTLPIRTVVFSDDPDAIYFLRRIAVRELPEKYSYLTTRINPSYNEQMRQLCRDLRGDAVLAYFSGRPNLPSPAEIGERLSMVPVMSGRMGRVFRASVGEELSESREC